MRNLDIPITILAVMYGKTAFGGDSCFWILQSELSSKGEPQFQILHDVNLTCVNEADKGTALASRYCNRKREKEKGDSPWPFNNVG